MLCFILSNRTNNSLGEPTFKKWHSKGSRNAWTFQYNDLGSKFSDLTNVVTPSTEEIDDFFKKEKQNTKIPYPTTSSEENHLPRGTAEENSPNFPSHQIANNIVNGGNGGIVNLTQEPTFQMENGKPIVPLIPSQFNKNNNTITMNGVSIQVPIQILSNVQITSEDEKHIKALYEIYTEKTGKTIDGNNIDQLPKPLKNHLTAQNRSYFALEEKQRAIRDVFSDGAYQFKVLKDDAFDGIEMTYLDEYSSGYERLNAVLEKITTITLDNSALKNVIGLIGNLEKRGICHILVNDEIINSWVDIDD
ncbi:ABC-three component system protein [Streptococcus suis]